MNHLSALPTVTPIAFGTRFHHYQEVYAKHTHREAAAMESDSGVNWALFPKGTSDEAIDLWLEAQGWAERRINSAYDCSGEYFAGSPWLQDCGLGVLARVSWGRDI